ncbi:MAG TPA: BTAD domain-containing putative transcriptional regulator [Actinocrinis sp.]|nr:BTAD domain-containing putative transcriptional regulator [Actinocrinis sp.]
MASTASPPSQRKPNADQGRNDQWSPQPQRIKHRRTFGDFVRGTGAFLLLLALLVGIPYAMVLLIGWPLPHHVPGADTFKQPLSQRTLLHALAVVVWLAWAQFAACVLIEFRAAKHGIGMPRHVFGAGPSQFLARQLVASILMITATAASFVPNLAHLGGGQSAPQARPATTATAAPHGGPAATGSGAPARTSPAMAPAAFSLSSTPVVQPTVSGATPQNTGPMVAVPDGVDAEIKLYRVTPPAGRNHDSLWDIAQRHLGDGRRYKEIFELNKDRVQPDGQKLTNASLIRPGWILAMPADATGGDLVVDSSVLEPVPVYNGPASTVLNQTAPPQALPSGSGALTPAAPGGITPTTAAPAQTSPARYGSAPAAALPAGTAPSAAGQNLPATTSSGAPPNPTAPNPAQTFPTRVLPAQSPAQNPSQNSGQAQNPAQGQNLPAQIAPSQTVPGGTGQYPTAPPSSSAANLPALSTGTQTGGAPTSVQPVAVRPAAAQPPAPLPPAAAANQTTNNAPTMTAGTAPLAPGSHRGSQHPDESAAGNSEDRLLYGLAGAPLLSAGLLLALRRHRRRQLWHRIFGRRPVTATGDGAAAEESIRIGAGEPEVYFLDLALRGLSASCIARGQELPAGYALRLRPEGLELMLSTAIDPSGPIRPPAPWYAAPDGRSWNFPRQRIGDVDADAARRCFAPYPGLVSIGRAGRDRLLIDLEEARGVIAVTGPPADRRAVLAALAAELATNSWSDRMSVTLVGFPGELTPLAPARIRHARTLDEVLPSLETEAAERERALRLSRLGSVLDGRARASQASSFPPHFVIVAEEPHPAILARLVSSAATTTRVGMGFVVAGEVTGAAWQFRLTGDDRIVAPELGVDASPQLLPEDQYAAILGLFRAVSEVRGAEIGPTQVHQSVGYSGALPDEPPSIYVAMLGLLEITGSGPVDQERAGLLAEALVYLVHHRDGVHPQVLAAALWPRGATRDVIESTFARLAEWLGVDRKGSRNLRQDPDGRLRLGPYVWSDWDQFQSLQSRALYDAGVQQSGQRGQLLSIALDLVRGPYLADRESGRYAWLAYEIAEAQVPAVIADTALQLADSCANAGLAEAAIDAVKAGMRGSPDDEELWRGLLRATAATGDMIRLEGAIEGLYKRTWYVHGVKGLHPRTEALVDELLPTWRTLIHS